MSTKELDLKEKICPYVVMEIIRKALKMKSGEKIKFLVCDPLALKSVPEELDDYDVFSIDINSHKEGWEIVIRRK